MVYLPWIGHRVTCLFFLVGSIALRSASFGQGTVPIAITNVGCTGHEARLLDCPHTENTCSHSADAGVRCHVRTSE